MGVDDYITKPFSLNELVARIDHFINVKFERNEWLKLQETEDEEPHTQVDNEHVHLQRVREIVLQNLSNPKFRVSDLAKQMFYSQRQLERIVKTYSGFFSIRFNKRNKIIKSI